MCLIVFAYRPDGPYRLVMAANRDEFHARPTLSADWWPEAADVLAGRDLARLGTWLGITRHGRIAALANIRDPLLHRGNARSRGDIVARYLLGEESPASFLAALRPHAKEYNGFNLLVGDNRELRLYSNGEEKELVLTPGVYGVSNGSLDSAWPKVTGASNELAKLLATEKDSITEELFVMLNDRRQAEESQLPKTGVSHERERLLSSRFIVSPAYGTRSSAVVLIDGSNSVYFAERTYDIDGQEAGRRDFSFQVR